MVGIADVARAAGVSQATASRALTGRGYVAEQTRKRVREAARRLDYVASSSAASLVTGRTQTIAMLVPELARWFFAEVVEGAQAALQEQRQDLVLYAAQVGTTARREVFEHFLARKRFDGIIAAGVEPDSHESALLTSFDRPVAAVGVSDPSIPTAGLDEAAAAHTVTDHLLALGHRDLVFLGGPAGGASAGDARRLDGARAAAAARGENVRLRHVACETTTPAGFTAAGIALAARHSRPTAVVAVCDEVAVGAVIAARRLGLRVPADISVIGIDDHPTADMFSLTTLRQFPREQGRTAVGLLTEGTRGGPDAHPAPVTARGELVLRTSTGPARR